MFLTRSCPRRADYLPMGKVPGLNGLVVDPEQSNCMLGKTIQDNLLLLCDLLAATEFSGLITAFISLDQEKAFDQVNHTSYSSLWRPFAVTPIHLNHPAPVPRHLQPPEDE